MAIFYNTVTNMAGLYIASDLGGSGEIAVYPMVFFGLGNLLAVPLADPLAGRFGSIKLLVYALLLYTLFSQFCAMAPTYVLLNFFRLGLGFASGFFLILCRRLAFAHLPEEKVKGYGFHALLLFAIVPVLGASFGAWVAYESHWRWIFHVNTPVSLALAAYFWHFHKQIDAKPSRLVLDWIGYTSFFLAFASLVTAATLSQELDWYRSPTWLSLLTLGLVALPFFLLWSWHHPTPIVNLRLLKRQQLSFSLLSLGVLFATYFGMIILIALWLNIYVNYTPTWIGVLVGIMALAGAAAIFLSRIFLHKINSHLLLSLSILTLAFSCYYSTYFDREVDFFHLAVARSFAGIGLILFLFAISDLCFKSCPPSKSPSVYLLFQISRTLCSSLGAGLYVILWQRRQAFFHERLGEKINLTSTFTAQYYQQATDIFSLTKPQATAQLGVFLDQQATSLALNDVFGCMGYILLGLLILVPFSYFYSQRKQV